jgi:hypothetical protein
MVLRIHLSNRADNEFLLSLLVLFLDPLVVLGSKLCHALERRLDFSLVLKEIAVLQSVSPVDFVQVH